MSLSTLVDDLERIPEHRGVGRIAGVAGVGGRIESAARRPAPEAPA